MGDQLLIGSINAYHICGGLLASWAVIVTAIGLRNHSFPRSTAQARVAGTISIALVLATIGTAIYEGTREADEEAAAEPAPASEPPPSGGETLRLEADKTQLAFNKVSLDAKAGPVTIKMTNPAPIPHNIAIEGNEIEKKGQVVQDGATSTVSATLKPGDYTFYCSVDGHKQAGMQGKLTVR